MNGSYKNWRLSGCICIIMTEPIRKTYFFFSQSLLISTSPFWKTVLTFTLLNDFWRNFALNRTLNFSKRLVFYYKIKKQFIAPKGLTYLNKDEKGRGKSGIYKWASDFQHSKNHLKMYDIKHVDLQMSFLFHSWSSIKCVHVQSGKECHSYCTRYL